MEETSFPRGTGASTTSSKKRSSSQEELNELTRSAKKNRKEENLFGNDFVKKRRSTTLVPVKGKSIDRGITTLPQGIQPGGGAVLPSSLHPHQDALIQSLSFSKLEKGMKLLGVVRADGVNEDYCIISLPNMLTGYIRRGIGGGDDNTPLTEILSPEQMLPVAIKSTSVDSQSKRKIELSIHPHDVNAGISPDQVYLPGLRLRGQIISIEDHGCIVNVGMGSAVTAFLKFENVHGYDVSSDLTVGRCFDFRVQKPISSVLSSSSSKKERKRRREMETATVSHILIQLILPEKDGKDDLNKQLTKSTGPSALIGGGMSSGKDAVKTSYTIKSLVPGMLIECNIEEYAKNGLLVTFLDDVFRGAIDENHLGFLLPESNSSHKSTETVGWKEIWKEEACVSEVTARIIAVDPISKILRLSLLPHILLLKSPPKPKFRTGDIIKGTSVIRVNGSVGALLATSYEDSEDSVENKSKKSKVEDALFSHPLSRLKSKYSAALSRVGIYVSASKAADDEDISDHNLNKLFKKEHTDETPIRILTSTHCLVENYYTASTAPGIIAAHVLSHSDLKPGQIYRNAKIVSYQDYGVIVSIGQNIRALCQTIHLSDTANASGLSSDYQRKAHRVKFAPGKMIDVKCISVDVANKQAYVTHKKSLISDKLSPLISHEQIAKNQIYMGCITKVDPNKGIIVAFYNNIYGYCTVKRLAKELGVENVSQSYRIGSVIKCRIVQLSRHNKKLELSLDTTADAIERDEKELQEGQNANKLRVGMHIPSAAMKVIQMVESSKDEVKNKTINGYAVVVVKLKHLPTEGKKSKGEIECRIPYEQLEDSFQQNNSEDVGTALDRIAKRNLVVGKKIGKDAIVLLAAEYTADNVPVISLRPSLVVLSGQADESNGEKKNKFIPSTVSDLYIGARVTGYVAHHDRRYGGFVRFANNLTGLIPKLYKGLEEKIFNTINCRVVGLDVNVSPPRVILKKSKNTPEKTDSEDIKINKGDLIGDVVVEDVNFYRANVMFMDRKFKHEQRGKKLRARFHVTMIDGKDLELDKSKNVFDEETKNKEKRITKYHPFHGWNKGLIIQNAICLSSEFKNGVLRVELTNRVSPDIVIKNDEKEKVLPPIVEKLEELTLNQNITCIVTEILKNNWGLKVQVCPGLSSNISGLELSEDVEILNNLSSHFFVGQKLACKVIEKVQPFYKMRNKQKRKSVYQLSALKVFNNKPKVNDILVARINRGIPSINSPSLMLDYRNGYVARCCITELTEVDDWVNMPLGRVSKEEEEMKDEKFSEGAIVTDEEKDADFREEEEHEDQEGEKKGEDQNMEYSYFPTGRYVKCKVFGVMKSVLDISLQDRRIKGHVEDDEPPKPKDIIQAFVVSTNKKGCYTRLSRNTTGRIILKELSDAFIPDPISAFPPGRLVQCKVKQVRRTTSKDGERTVVDLDMRESSILESQDKLTFDEIKEGEKYKGIITRIERYGVFVRLENSQVAGLAHISECSDKFMKGGLGEHYDPGDLVKAYVLKIDNEQKKINFSLKASHFEGDTDSDDESSSSSGTESSEEMSSSDEKEIRDDFSDSDDNSLDSNDSNYASRLAAKMKNEKEETDDESDSEETGDESEDDSSSSDEEERDSSPQGMMDTDIGFDWDGNNSKQQKTENDDESSSDDDSSSSSSDEDDNTSSRNNKKKSRKKAAQKRREEKEIAQRESALADGTLDENPETRADFERLIASNPNFSEHWIKFMAYYLSLADIESARSVANRAFDRIEFRQEGEKLNVWTALLTLELKYGSPSSLQQTIDRACQHNNPKQVYLRVCEMLERIVTDGVVASGSTEGAKLQVEAVTNADEMFHKMCKKFKSKKTVWIAHLKYLLKSSRYQEAHELLKRSMKSLPSYKHVEVMTKFAQMEFEFGNVERGRTIFDSMLLKYPKRLDLLYVYVDKEVKAGEMEAARSIFRKMADPQSTQGKFKFSDKQMKGLFKKWYRIEELKGTDDSREEVKAAAKAYVERNAS